jgi:hypothetical protein
MATKKNGKSKEGKAARSTKGYGTSWKVASNAKQNAKDRSKALLNLTSGILESDAAMRGTLDLIKDREAPVSVRLTALRVVQAASFSSAKFNAWKPAYLAALRAASTDPDPELRQRVLGILAREQDGKTQQRLLDGLKNPDKALLAPEKALQLLSYDVHAETYPVAREIVQKPPNDDARREALRLLAADAGSVGLFESLLRDKAESSEVRQICAAALHTLAPKALQSHAREIVLDDDDDDEVRAASLTALTYFGGEAPAKDDKIQAQVGKLNKAGKSKALKDSARQYLQKHPE